MIRKATAHRIRVLFLLPATVCLLLALAACVQVEQTLSLNPDGSGTIDITYGMPEEGAAQMASFLGSGLSSGEDGLDGAAVASPFDFNDEDVRKDFREYEADGVVLESVKTETREGWRYRRMVIRFRDLAGLARTGFLSEHNVSLTRDAAGRYVFVQSAGSNGAAEDLPRADPALNAWLKGFRAVLRLRTPSRILETNAPEHNDRQATWTFDVDHDPEALQKAQRTSMRAVFEGQGVSIPDFKCVADSDR